jgi:hypothetical protein
VGAFYAEKNPIKRGEIARRQMSSRNIKDRERSRFAFPTSWSVRGMKDQSMTVWIYIKSAKEVGDEDHLRSSPMRKRLSAGSPKTIPKA